MQAWFSQHRAALGSALRRLGASPLNTLLSLLVIGIALTLPGFGYVILDNLRYLGAGKTVWFKWPMSSMLPVPFWRWQ